MIGHPTWVVAGSGIMELTGSKALVTMAVNGARWPPHQTCTSVLAKRAAMESPGPCGRSEGAVVGRSVMTAGMLLAIGTAAGGGSSDLEPVAIDPAHAGPVGSRTEPTSGRRAGSPSAAGPPPGLRDM